MKALLAKNLEEWIIDKCLSSDTLAVIYVNDSGKMRLAVQNRRSFEVFVLPNRKQEFGEINPGVSVKDWEL